MVGNLSKHITNNGMNGLMASKNEKKHFDKIARLGCILCSEFFGIEGSPAELHHVRRYGAKRASSPILPLCPEHHRFGQYGISIHSGKKIWEERYGTEAALLEKVSKLVDL